MWFQAFVEAVACDVTGAARRRACAELRLAWQHAVTVSTRRLGLLRPALWPLRNGWTRARRLRARWEYCTRRSMTLGYMTRAWSQGRARWLTVWRQIALKFLVLAHALSELGIQAYMAYRALVLRRLPRGLAQLGTGAATASRFIAINGLALRRTPSALRTGWAAFRTTSLDLLPARSELRSRWAMSGPLLALNLFMAGLLVFFSIRIGHALFTPDSQSPSRIAHPIAVTAPGNHDVAPSSRSRGANDVIATRTLFHPNRSEPKAITQILPPAATLALYGVVISDDTRLAYLQDLATKQILGYKTGDKLAGGQVERIEPDRVVIMRADGPIEVLLHRPKEPLPVLPSPEEGSPRRSRGRQE